MKGHYMWRDLKRLCADLALSLRRPDPFPQDSLLAARVALVGLDANWGDGFCRGIPCRVRGRAVHRRPANHRRGACATGYRARAYLAAAHSEPIKARLRAQTEEARQLGIFGAPSFVCADCELFWGNDRLEQALRWANGR